VESEITAFFAVLAMSDDLKRALLAMGLCEVLVPMTSSDNVEVQGNSAAALSNLSSMGSPPPNYFSG
jgi:vacuolar protein 8